MQAYIILCKHTYLGPRVGSTDQNIFSESHVAYQIKKMECRARCKHIVCPYINRRPLVVGSKGQKKI